MTNTELAKQLAEHPRWQPMAGMRLDSPDGWARVDDDDPDTWEGWPDLGDGATQGCLIEMIGGRFERLHYRRHTADLGGTLWSVLVLEPSGRRQDRRGYTLGEALARALLAAWGDGA